VAKILIVDDEPDILLMLRMSLEDEGHDVVMAADGQMALDRMAEHRPDLVLLDVMMPVLDGWGVLEQRRDSGDPTAVIMLSAKSEEADIDRAMALGAREYVVKPFDLDKLVALVQRVLAE
jgi:DNA-binding response OmpR family regulator